MTDSVENIERRADSLVADHENLLRELVAWRNRHNLSQAEIAERMGVSQPTVAAFERYDANPTLASIRRYALAIGVRLETKIIDDCSPSFDEEFTRIVDDLVIEVPTLTAGRVDWHGEVRSAVVLHA